MINCSQAPNQKTTIDAVKQCEAPSMESAGPSPKVGLSSTEGNFDGPGPSAVPITKRSVAPLTRREMLMTAARVIKEAKVELQRLKEKLIICNDKVDRFELDFLKIRLWEKYILDKFPKGMLLSSPPGYGKTVFMQNVGNMIVGEDKERIEFITGADLLHKLSGKNKDECFSKAKSYHNKTLNGFAQRKCFVYCVDEIDSAFMKGSRYMHTDLQENCRNFFQAILAGGPELTIPNIYVIGTTNVKISNYHPALIRSGRLENHITFDSMPLVNNEKLINLYLKAHPSIRVDDKDMPLLSALYEDLTPADIKDQIDLIATGSAIESFAKVPVNGEQTKAQRIIPFTAFKQTLYPIGEINDRFKDQVKQLTREHPYFPDLSYTRSQMKEALSLLTDITKRQDTGIFSIILVQGRSGSGKTAFLHELLKHFKAGDTECFVDHYTVIKSVNYNEPKGHSNDYNKLKSQNNMALLSAEDLSRSTLEYHNTILAMDDGEWLAGTDFLPCRGEKVCQHDPSKFINDWNQTENRKKKNNTILLVTFDGHKILQKLETARVSGLVTASEFKAATGLRGVIEGVICLPDYVEDTDIDQLAGKLGVDDTSTITDILKGKKLTIKQLMSIIYSSQKNNGTKNADRLKNLLEINDKCGPEAPDHYY
ncbi:ATP-binding protein [Endozoicomonas sp. ONNA2]|uniref:AAA family ATPase n=1 Tax=Endozoicomonas sp. ONNA2 TaxID=2828741 RepID=UPI00214830D0|nr:ATP-binding protein [Endozoicomonas sp. ONNA2]